MLFLNHGLTGIALGLSIDDPVILVPSAVASHLVLDATPHFGYHDVSFESKNGTEFRIPKVFFTGLIDGVIAVALLITALSLFPERRTLITIGWFGAVAPDLLYLPEVIAKTSISGKFGAFHEWIQWYEREPGLITEIIWFGLMSTVIVSRL
jgi:hypothetical protein